MSNSFRMMFLLSFVYCTQSQGGWILKQKIEHSSNGGKPYTADRTVRISEGQYRLDESRGKDTHSVIVSKQGTLACDSSTKRCMRVALPGGLDALSSVSAMGIKIAFDRITVKPGKPQRKIAKLTCTPHTVDAHVSGKMSGQMLPGMKMSMDGSHKVNGCLTKDAGYGAVAKQMAKQLDSAVAGLIAPSIRPSFQKWVEAGLLLEGTEVFTMKAEGVAMQPITTTMKTKTLSATSGAIAATFFQTPAGYKIQDLREVTQQQRGPQAEENLESDLVDAEEIEEKETAPAVPKAKAKSRVNEQIEDAVSDKVKDLLSF